MKKFKMFSKEFLENKPRFNLSINVFLSLTVAIIHYCIACTIEGEDWLQYYLHNYFIDGYFCLLSVMSAEFVMILYKNEPMFTNKAKVAFGLIIAASLILFIALDSLENKFVELEIFAVDAFVSYVVLASTASVYNHQIKKTN